ncbi:MAG: fumarylacetoacetate hydrolase family protein, partial [Pseudomonadota bacterium]
MDLFDIPVPRLPVSGSEQQFPVHRIYCIGRNYADHVREMGGEPDRTPPTYFLKPADVIAPGDGKIPYPPRTEDLHYEVEMVVALFKGGHDIRAESALDHIFGYAVGIDLTRRDLQDTAKSVSGPWDTGKSFEHAAPISAIRRVSECGHPV